MEVKFNAQGKDRKNLVAAISKITGAKATYKGVPSFAYELDCFTIDRLGTVSFDNRADREKLENLLEKLEKKGFTTEPQDSIETDTVAEKTKSTENANTEEQTSQGETLGLTVAMQRDYFTGNGFSNLEHLLEAKGSLIKKALDIDSLPIETDEEKVSFPWFSITPDDSDTVNSYTHLIYALCEMARKQKHIQAKKKEVENEKYAFRCFLLRLGFIGVEYKAERTILLKNFTGSSAFKGGAKNEISK
ncbi:MAG: virulence protein [Peptostreptococcaceae bacterium]|nr:virulence protein [Peptostreptococcaceae bacterium]